jgi:hypothetical protein
VELEITQEIKMRDRDLIPHPFVLSDFPAGAKVIMLDPVCDCNHELLQMHEAGMDVSKAIYDGRFKIGNTVKRNTHKDVMCVDFNWR